jgi:hypothetical protein
MIKKYILFITIFTSSYFYGFEKKTSQKKFLNNMCIGAGLTGAFSAGIQLAKSGLNPAIGFFIGGLGAFGTCKIFSESYFAYTGNNLSTPIKKENN